MTVLMTHGFRVGFLPESATTSGRGQLRKHVVDPGVCLDHGMIPLRVSRFFEDPSEIITTAQPSPLPGDPESRSGPPIGGDVAGGECERLPVDGESPDQKRGRCTLGPVGCMRRATSEVTMTFLSHTRASPSACLAAPTTTAQISALGCLPLPM
jgi:hypothetical protein